MKTSLSLFRIVFLSILVVFVVNFVVLFVYFPVSFSPPNLTSLSSSSKDHDGPYRKHRGSVLRKKQYYQQRPPLKPRDQRHHQQQQHQQKKQPNQLVDPNQRKETTKENLSNKSKRSDCPFYGCPIYPPELTNPELNQTIRRVLESSGLEFELSPLSSESKPKPSKNIVEFDFGADSFATLSQQGKSHVYNQDRAVYIPTFLSDLLLSTSTSSKSAAAAAASTPKSFLVCIFDGHGKLGHDVAQEVVEKFPLLLAEKLTLGLDGGGDNEFTAFRNAIRNNTDIKNNNIISSSSSSIANNEAILVHTEDYDRTDFIIQKALHETFLEVSENGTRSAFLLGGCTASVTLRWRSRLYVANAGDSQTILVSAVVSTENKQQNQQQKQKKSVVAKVEYQTRKDKANQPGERARIEKLGGKIHVNPKGFDPRVIVHSKAANDTIGLAMSRSLGDWEWKEVGVTAEPTIGVIDLSKLSESSAPQKTIFLLAASDGFWDMRQQQFLAFLAAASFVIIPKGDDGNSGDTRNGKQQQRLRPLFHLYDIIRRITPKVQKGYRDDITATIVHI
uniref:PPM-type phosphatase domain-containing protein n=1 Tax=Pseudo-nitzschia australis TaxID=44445 RepID=A0A6U9ZZ29_9STRA|mmetsp:Transcript_25222/g.55301  ORF Transcript_25222/g.55301 Transcript_25222/m.55301 type:complete len:561 (-) Transcript_25222:72-1754(-)